MQRQNIRVILASEYPEVRHFLKDVVEEEGSVIIGQARNAAKALTLARNLRPDVILIDYRLPHAVGLDTVPLSRTGGLDTAQTISEELPKIVVILLTNLTTEVLAGNGLGLNTTVVFSIERLGADTPFALQDFGSEVIQPNALIFANVEMKPTESVGWKITSLSVADVVFIGIPILCILGLLWVLSIMTGDMLVMALPAAAVFGFGIGLLINRLKQPKIKR